MKTLLFIVKYKKKWYSVKRYYSFTVQSNTVYFVKMVLIIKELILTTKLLLLGDRTMDAQIFTQHPVEI